MCVCPSVCEQNTRQPESRATKKETYIRKTRKSKRRISGIMRNFKNETKSLLSQQCITERKEEAETEEEEEEGN